MRNELASRVEVEKVPEGRLLRPGDVLVHGLVDVPLAVTWAWCTHCNHLFFLWLCNQVFSPAKWNVARSWSAKRCAGIMVGHSRRLLWRQTASGAARLDAHRAKPPCFADHGCSWRWCAVWQGSWSVGFRFHSLSRQPAAVEFRIPSFLFSAHSPIPFLLYQILLINKIVYFKYFHCTSDYVIQLI